MRLYSGLAIIAGAALPALAVVTPSAPDLLSTPPSPRTSSPLTAWVTLPAPPSQTKKALPGIDNTWLIDTSRHPKNSSALDATDVAVSSPLGASPQGVPVRSSTVTTTSVSEFSSTRPSPRPSLTSSRRPSVSVGNTVVLVSSSACISPHCISTPGPAPIISDPIPRIASTILLTPSNGSWSTASSTLALPSTPASQISILPPSSSTNVTWPMSSASSTLPTQIPSTYLAPPPKWATSIWGPEPNWGENCTIGKAYSWMFPNRTIVGDPYPLYAINECVHVSDHVDFKAIQIRIHVRCIFYEDGMCRKSGGQWGELRGASTGLVPGLLVKNDTRVKSYRCGHFWA